MDKYMQNKSRIILILIFFISYFPELPYRGSMPFLRYSLSPDDTKTIKGELDTSFNGTGYILQDVGSDYDEGYSLVIQSDGKILLAGSCIEGYNKFCIARFRSNGELDRSFNAPRGKILLNIVWGSGSSLSIQSDRKILLGGSCSDSGASKFCIARFK